METVIKYEMKNVKWKQTTHFLLKYLLYNKITYCNVITLPFYESHCRQSFTVSNLYTKLYQKYVSLYRKGCSYRLSIICGLRHSLRDWGQVALDSEDCFASLPQDVQALVWASLLHVDSEESVLIKEKFRGHCCVCGLSSQYQSVKAPICEQHLTPSCSLGVFIHQ